ncbi:hypothetical protein POTOM_001986 [Populus tomentosa]|uniref:Uncharacterized protein n=1 Tax=Populus tomentosa TaxID=118781 RepID=A0A8X8IX06_POPTO|nr:hypothetical protein POTOM_001986 [Populus tomentosa]
MTRNVLLNGRKRRLDYGGGAYVTQENTLLGTLTVRETLTYSAHLRLPSSMAKAEIDDIVEETIMEMGLQECSDRLIGNWHLRGLSGGEKKRLSIALETLIRPQLLFLDEPTSGLDSAAAFFVIQTLRNIAHDGRTVISSVHQPSSEFFAEAGFPCPNRRNPSDHFLRCINSDFDLVTATLMGSHREIQNPSDPLANLPTAAIKASLVKKYISSKHAVKARARIQEILAIKGLVINIRGENQANWWKQLSTLTKRSFINMWRDLGYYWVRIIVYILLSICVGTMFLDVGKGYTAILAHGACGGFLSGFMTFMSVGGFPSFIEELKVFLQGKAQRILWGRGVYTIKLSFFFSLLDCDVICIATVESCMMTIASLVPNYLMGFVIGSGCIGILMMTSGLFRLLPDIPKVFWRYPISYINFGAWGLQGAYKNDMIGLEFDPLVPGGPKLKGEEVLTTVLGISLDHSKWWDLAAVVLILIAFRLLFFAILKFKERILPVFRKLCAKRTLKQLKKRPSFTKTSYSPFPSIRNQPAHSLSSQEGLSFPVPY